MIMEQILTFEEYIRNIAGDNSIWVMLIIEIVGLIISLILLHISNTIDRKKLIEKRNKLTIE
ncbi:MAG: hypothetical protein IJJ82_07820 [Clostridia bacterium]|nr:hypothetical protein [Clostridia bacterium]